MKYEKLLSHATYAPWRDDFAFLDCFEEIKASTLVDIYRCYELWNLVGQTAKLEKGALLEIGVWRGGTGALIATRAAHCAILEPVYLCDTFQGVVKAGPNDSSYKGGEHSDTSRAIVDALLAKLQLSNTKVVMGVFPDESGACVIDPFFRFCHIDVDVYESAKGCLEWVWGRLVPGGIVVFDDYGFSTCSGVTQVVNELKDSWDLHFIHNLNGHAIFIKCNV